MFLRLHNYSNCMTFPSPFRYTGIHWPCGNLFFFILQESCQQNVLGDPVGNKPRIEKYATLTLQIYTMKSNMVSKQVSLVKCSRIGNISSGIVSTVSRGIAGVWLGMLRFVWVGSGPSIPAYKPLHSTQWRRSSGPGLSQVRFIILSILGYRPGSDHKLFTVWSLYLSGLWDNNNFHHISFTAQMYSEGIPLDIFIRHPTSCESKYLILG